MGTHHQACHLPGSWDKLLGVHGGLPGSSTPQVPLPPPHGMILESDVFCSPLLNLDPWGMQCESHFPPLHENMKTWQMSPFRECGDGGLLTCCRGKCSVRSLHWHSRKSPGRALPPTTPTQGQMGAQSLAHYGCNVSPILFTWKSNG